MHACVYKRTISMCLPACSHLASTSGTRRDPILGKNIVFGLLQISGVATNLDLRCLQASPPCKDLLQKCLCRHVELGIKQYS